jgi:hypothetical protein
VGYGDVVPTTYWGRLVAVMIQVSGTLLLVLPLGVMQENFISAHNKGKLSTK